MPSPEYAVRSATHADLDLIARHRAEMFRDIDGLDDVVCASLLDASRRALDPLLRTGDYLGWLAAPTNEPHRIVGGVGIRLRDTLPSVRRQDEMVTITVGRQGLIVNVFVERAWRRRGIAALLMRALLHDVPRLQLASIVLHASPEGRALYQSLGFVATNEMRYFPPPVT